MFKLITKSGQGKAGLVCFDLQIKYMDWDLKLVHIIIIILQVGSRRGANVLFRELICHLAAG